MKKILVVGGGAYQVPLIKRIVQMGHMGLCIDKNPQSPGFEYASESAAIDVIDIEACLEYAQRKEIDAVMTYGATLPLPTVAYIGRHMGLPVLPMETAEISKNKYLIKQKLREAGCNICGDFFRMSSVSEAMEHDYSYPCVIKPCDGSGSKGVSIVREAEALERAVLHASESARYGEFYCERFIAGSEYSVEAFVDHTKIFIYGIFKTTFEIHGKDNESIEYGHCVPCGLRLSVDESIRREVEAAIRGLGINMGSVNFDVIVSETDGKPYIIDCGIRVGQNLIASHIIPLSRGVDILDNAIKQALGESINAEPKKQECIATRLLIYNPGIIRNIKDYSNEIGNNGVIDIVLRKKPGDIQRPYMNKSDTCGWVLCTGKTPEEAEFYAANARRRLKAYFDIEEDCNVQSF